MDLNTILFAVVMVGVAGFIIFDRDDMVFNIGSTEIFRIQDVRLEILQGDIRTTIDNRNRTIIEHI